MKFSFQIKTKSNYSWGEKNTTKQKQTLKSLRVIVLYRKKPVPNAYGDMPEKQNSLQAHMSVSKIHASEGLQKINVKKLFYQL